MTRIVASASRRRPAGPPARREEAARAECDPGIQTHSRTPLLPSRRRHAAREADAESVICVHLRHLRFEQDPIRVIRGLKRSV
jgi:hypothetical protein